MGSVIRKSGIGPAILLSESLPRKAHLSLGQKVSIRVQYNTLIIEPCATPAYPIDDLVARINEANLHTETDFGKSVGREIGPWS